jgi:predicted membrane protein (TIGR00267 family)
VTSMTFSAWRKKLQSYDNLANISEIARRYFAMNTFDGLLTIIGVLMGNLAAGVFEARIVVSTGLATSVAMGISGLWGSYLTEAAERKRSLQEMESQTLLDLSDSHLGHANRAAAIIVATVDGLSPFAASLLVLSPFFFAALLPSPMFAYYISLGLALLALFAVGGFLGVISRENVILSGIKMIGAGLVSILVASLLPV